MGSDHNLCEAQIARLFERSPFYRGKLAAAGFGNAATVGGLELAEKDQPERCA